MRYFTLAAVTILGLAANAQAQSLGFACPKAGTTEERGVYKTQYTGASPSDPMLCNAVDSWGKPQALLFNFYRPADIEGADVRAGMTELFAGRKTSVSFKLGAGSAETWTVLRHEPVTVSGKTIDTVVFDQERERFPTSTHPFHGHYTRWLDAKDGLWLKAEMTIISGQTAMERKPFQDTAITLP